MKIIKKQKDVFREKYIKNSKINVTLTAKQFNVDRSTIYNWMNEINKK